MKFGIIGAGSISGIYAAAIECMAGGSLHSVYHPRGGTLGARYQVRSFSCLSEFLADPELNIITIATPSGVKWSRKTEGQHSLTL
jgi:predicted dehydrogenase